MKFKVLFILSFVLLVSSCRIFQSEETTTAKKELKEEENKVAKENENKAPAKGFIGPKKPIKGNEQAPRPLEVK